MHDEEDLESSAIASGARSAAAGPPAKETGAPTGGLASGGAEDGPATGASEGTHAGDDATAPEQGLLDRAGFDPPPGWEECWAALDGLGAVDGLGDDEAGPASPAPVDGGRAWAAHEGRHAYVVSTARLDVATFLEADRPFPVAFRDFAALASWARAGGLHEPRAVGPIPRADAAQVVGTYRVEGADLRLPYD